LVVNKLDFQSNARSKNKARSTYPQIGRDKLEVDELGRDP